jgi:Glycosyl hydrolase-like 10
MKKNTVLGKKNLPKLLVNTLMAGLITSGSLISPLSVKAESDQYCILDSNSVNSKDNLRKASLKGSTDQKNEYRNLIKKHAEILRKCRNESWLKEQAIWLRLYPCDLKEGALDEILDRIVNKGYNKIYLEVFYDSQVLLPPKENNTPWISVLDGVPGGEKVDLLAETIKKGRERGLKVYAWLFTMNFGYSYAQLPDKQGVLARNGKGEDSVEFVHDRSQAFIDPYNRQAQIEYYNLVQKVIQRNPDGILFDYIRYPRGSGSQSVVTNVKDLWIYSPASKQALYQRALNNQGQWLIHRYVNKGYITVKDIEEVRAMAPEETTPLWQGRTPSPSEADLPLADFQKLLQLELWHLAVAHAAQGVVDFISFASAPAQKAGIATGAVFFPGGNQLVGERGFDSRLQPWHQFPSYLQRHPMSYAVCGQANCIADEVERVTKNTAKETKVIPALAGLWGANLDQRPSLETQMEAIRRNNPSINAISHFAFSWQESEFDKERKFCKL